jgi:hypothetical protein
MNIGDSDLGLPAEVPRTLLPVGPLLMLPAGDTEVFDDGHLLAFNHQWVVAVGLSNTFFLVIRDRHPKYVEAHQLHELYGYLKACGCDLWPMDFRCPLDWRLLGNFTAIRRLWANGIGNAPESNDALGSQADVEAHLNKQPELFNEEKAP